MLYVDLTGCNRRTRYFFAYLAGIKRLQMQLVELGMRRAPAIRYRGVTVTGLHTCVGFILESRPEPELLPTTRPDRTAVIRDFSEMLLTQQMDLNELAPLYRNSNPKTAQRLNLLDLAVAACASSRMPDSFDWVQRAANDVQKIVDEQEHSEPSEIVA